MSRRRAWLFLAARVRARRARARLPAPSNDRDRELDRWLEESAWDKRYWIEVRRRALALGSDGCSGVPDWLIWTCHEHDVHYRSRRMLDGRPIDKTTADYIFRVRIQQGSPLEAWGLGFLSPVSWWRWLGLKTPCGEKAWNDGGRGL